MTTTPAGDPTSAEVRAYISDMLSQLADLAHGTGDRRLEASMRLLAVEAELAVRRRTHPSKATEG